MLNLPKYRSHKIVGAAPITSVTDEDMGDGYRVECGEHGSCKVSNSWVSKHDPRPGFMLVEYADGYLSVSPLAAFEQGYRPLETYADEEARPGAETDERQQSLQLEVNKNTAR